MGICQKEDRPTRRRKENRCKGIEIGCYDKEIDELKYPLKLVSASYKGTYEECDKYMYFIVD